MTPSMACPFGLELLHRGTSQGSEMLNRLVRSNKPPLAISAADCRHRVRRRYKSILKRKGDRIGKTRPVKRLLSVSVLAATCIM